MNFILKTFILLTVLLFSACNETQQNIKSPQSLKEVKEVKEIPLTKAMAVTASKFASSIATQVMHKGGNAFDAAIAAQFALAVAYPQAGDLGGGGFAVFRRANGEIGSLDFREKAPRRAKPSMFLDKNKKVIKGLSTDSGLSIGIPGIVDGMIHLHRRFGRVPFNFLIQPSINLAKRGFIISEKMAETLNKYQDAFKKVAKTKHLFIKDKGWKAGDKIIRPKLAATLERIRDLGRAGFYGGKTARNLIKEVSTHKGIINHQDLINYNSIWRSPIVSNYKGYKIISMPPPSSGGIGMTQILKSIEPYDIQELGFNSSYSIQLLTEAMRRSFADRAHFLGDPEFIKIPLKTLLSKSYNQLRMGKMNFKKATKSKDISHGKISKGNFQESNETTHYSIVDNQGNAISITVTLNSNFGSKIFVKESGFFLNNEMDDFSKKPNTPNQFGLTGTKANEIRGDKRMLSSMTPTIITKDNKLFMVLGSPGGPTIITNLVQTFLNVVEHGMSMQQAVDAPRIHHQYLPDVIKYENGAISKNVHTELMKRGYYMKLLNGTIGQTNAILVTPDGLEAGVDYRGEGENTAEGY